MPSFSSPSSIRVASQDHVLRLKITHNLVHGSPSDDVHSVKGRLPKDLDILWLSDITVSLSGSLDGRQIPAHDIARSGLVRHLQMQLKVNADQLGLNNVSRPFVDDTDGLSKLTLTPSRPLPYVSRPYANLVSLHLAYIWRTVAGRSDVADSSRLVEETNPFAPTILLPAEALFNRVIEQFLVYHFVSRYPLIFGPWCKRLDLEMQFFSSVGHSIVEIMARSQNHRFLLKCKRLLKIARRKHKCVLQACTAALSSCTDDTASESLEQEIDDPPVTSVLTDERILCESLEQLFRVGVPHRRFKPAATPQFRSLPQDDDDNLLQCAPDVERDDEVFWAELPEIATSPCALVADSYRTLQEDMDIFIEEEGGMWRLGEADAWPGEREFDAQSDESLINGAISLADIITRSPQSDPIALYHPQDTDHRELGPAASGLRYKVSQLAFLDEAGPSALFTSSHDPHYSENYEQLIQGTGPCQVDFESLDDFSEGGDSMLFDADLSGGAEYFEEPLV